MMEVDTKQAVAVEKKTKWTDSQESAMTLRGKTILVSAAAGSGKTSVLTERIIRSLTAKENPASLSDLLVVTFTRSAAADLKAKISKALSKELAKNPDDPHLQKQLFLLGGAQISTIDSFFGQALRQCFEQTGLPAGFRLADAGEIMPLNLQIMDSVIRDFYENERPQDATSVFSPLNGNTFARTMDHLLSNRSDASLDEQLVLIASRFLAYPEGLELLQQTAAHYREYADGEFMHSRPGHRLTAWLTDLFTYYHTELRGFGEYLLMDDDAAAYFSGLCESETSFCQSVLQALQTESYDEVRKIVFTFQKSDFPRMKNKPAVMETYHEVRKALIEDVEKLKEDVLSASPVEVRHQLLTTASLLETLYQVFSEYRRRSWEEKCKRGLVEFDDVREQLYRLLIRPDGSPSPLADALSAQFKEVYIDEYQDVDYIQDRIFSLIGQDRRFMVGDIKQSIYGFRGSEPSIFSSYRQAFPLHTESSASDDKGVCVFMSENFRCDSPVIDFANHICSFLFSACKETVDYRPQDDLKFSKKYDEPPVHPPVEVQTVVFQPYPIKRRNKKDPPSEESEEKPNREAIWVANEIARLLQNEVLNDGTPVRPSHIAILARTAAQGETFFKALTERGIPCVSKDDDELLHTPLFSDLLNLLRVIDNPHRDLPLSEFLLSERGGFSLDEVTAIRENDDDRHSLYDALTVTASSEHPLSEKARTFVDWLEARRREASAQPADRFLRRLYLDPLFAKDASEPVCRMLYEQARIYQRSSWCGLYGFLDHIQKKMDRDELSCGGFRKAEEAVTVMTIHASKGLEYPVVFLGACGSDLKGNKKSPPFLFHRPSGCAAKLYDPALHENRSTILYEIVKEQKKMEETEEAIRTLYVALTRARERLYVTGTPRGNLDSAMDSARLLRRGSRHSILNGGTYLRWILAALLEKDAKTSEFPCIFRHISLSDPLDAPIEDTPRETDPASGDPSSETVKSGDRYQAILDRQSTFVYPLEALQGIPTKAAASKLRPDLLDRLNDSLEDAALSAQIELMEGATPSFDRLLAAKRQPSAAEIGTATHAFLEFCDLLALPDRGIDEELSRLVKEEFLSPETASMINRDHLERLLTSNLMDMIRSASEIRREQTFQLLLPLRTLTTSTEQDPILDGQSVFVQGSIDLLLRTADGRLLLVDYKTDHIPDAERASEERLITRMTQAHGDQLACYALAVKKLYGKAPDAIYLYSLPLGRAIPIPVDESRFL